jgi:transposase-like protein
MPKVQYCASEKLAVLQEIESGQIGVKAAAKKYGITKQPWLNGGIVMRYTDTKG